MNEKTITTKLTHDIIKKDFIALHLNSLKIMNLVLLGIVVAVLSSFLGEMFSESTVVAIFFSVLLGMIAIFFLILVGTPIYQTIQILTKKYKVITVPVTQREDRYTLWLKRFTRKQHFSLKTDNLIFGENGSFRLEKHTYYKWSPMFEMSDKQIFEHAQIGAKYHLVLAGKTIVMIYNAETFLLENQ